MDSPPPLSPDPGSASADPIPPVQTSLAARLMNMIAAPGEVFEEVKASPVKLGNWLVPAILAAIAAVVFQLLVFSQESIVREVRAASTSSIQAKIDAGKMTADQGKKVIEMTENMLTPTTLSIFGSISGASFVFIEIFGLAGILWLTAISLLKVEVTYMKMVEFIGLTMMVDALQKVVRGLLVIWKGTLLANPGPVLFIDSPALTKRHDLILAIMDLTDIWWLCLVALAITTVCRVRYWKSAIPLFLLWYGLRIGWVLLTVRQ